MFRVPVRRMTTGTLRYYSTAALRSHRGLRFTEQQSKLIEREKKHIQEIYDQVRILGGAEEAERLKLLTSARENLDSLFMLVVIGEFNSGKSTFINALVGKEVAKTGVVPTTGSIHVISVGPEEEQREQEQEPGATESSSVVHINVPTSEPHLFDRVHIVDTPGTNAILRDHERLTRDFVPRCDLVLFVTSADRPFTESERQFLLTLSEWGRHVLFVVNKGDLLGDSEEARMVVQHVRDAAERTMASTSAVAKEKSKPSIPGMSRPGKEDSPMVYLLSARNQRRIQDGQRDKISPLQYELPELMGIMNQDNTDNLSGGFDELTAYIGQLLHGDEYIRWKLQTPLFITQRVVDQGLHQLKEETESNDRLRGQIDRVESALRRAFANTQREVETTVKHLQALLTEHMDIIISGTPSHALTDGTTMHNNLQAVAGLPMVPDEGKVRPGATRTAKALRASWADRFLSWPFRDGFAMEQDRHRLVEAMWSAVGDEYKGREDIDVYDEFEIMEQSSTEGTGLSSTTGTVSPTPAPANDNLFSGPQRLRLRVRDLLITLTANIDAQQNQSALRISEDLRMLWREHDLAVARRPGSMKPLDQQAAAPEHMLDATATLPPFLVEKQIKDITNQLHFRFDKDTRVLLSHGERLTAMSSIVSCLAIGTVATIMLADPIPVVVFGGLGLGNTEAQWQKSVRDIQEVLNMYQTTLNESMTKQKISSGAAAKLGLPSTHNVRHPLHRTAEILQAILEERHAAWSEPILSQLSAWKLWQAKQEAQTKKMVEDWQRLDTELVKLGDEVGAYANE
eukprot:Clim_evm32s202 gene=Clim_evmTU32s202